MFRHPGPAAPPATLNVTEFEHRLANGLQVIAAMLDSQSRRVCPEAAGALSDAAQRVLAFGRVHHRLRIVGTATTVEFGQCMRDLCTDLGRLLGGSNGCRAIVVEAGVCELPSRIAMPLGYAVNELITNAFKHGAGNILVRLDRRAGQYCLSVRDGGSGLPARFDLGLNGGMGMRILLALVKQINGEIHAVPSTQGTGACFEIRFSAETTDADCIFAHDQARLNGSARPEIGCAE